MIYQHEARGADKAITDAIDKHVQNMQIREGGDGADRATTRSWAVGFEALSPGPLSSLVASPSSSC